MVLLYRLSVIFVIRRLEKFNLSFSFPTGHGVLIFLMILRVFCGERPGLFRLLLVVKVDSLVDGGSVVSVSGPGQDSGVCFRKMIKVTVVIEDLIVLNTPDLQFNGFGPEYISDLLNLLFSIELIVTPDNLLLKILQLLYRLLL